MLASIGIKMDNAAFEDCPASELARILRDLAGQIENGELPPVTLRDINGNNVGKFMILETSRDIKKRSENA
jgi:hypothetical protein